MSRTQNLDVVERFFASGPELDRTSVMSEDCEWWNGMGKFPGAPGQTLFRGRDEIGRLILGRAPSPPQPNGRRVDRYDLATKSFDDVHVIADGDYVFRQHTYRATTMRGRPYENVYGFLFRFNDDGLIDRIWEHWGTLAAYEQLFQGPLVVHDPDYLLMSMPSVRKRLDLNRPVDKRSSRSACSWPFTRPTDRTSSPTDLFSSTTQTARWRSPIFIAMLCSEFIDRPRTDARGGQRRSVTAPPNSASPRAYSTCATICTRCRCCASRSWRAAPTATAQGVHGIAQHAFWQASRWGSIIPTVWSFMLALRSRGLGSAWTTITLIKEREVADVLGIPYGRWMQAGLFPIAYTRGTDFKPTPRRPAADYMHWNGFT